MHKFDSQNTKLSATAESHAVLPPMATDPKGGCSARELVHTARGQLSLVPLREDLSVGVYSIPEAIIAGERYPLVFASNLAPSVSSAIWESHLIRPIFDWDTARVLDSQAATAGTITRLNSPIIFLASPGSDNFYHWMHDCLPRYLAIRHAGIDLPILIPQRSEKNKFISESLKLLGVADEKIVEFPGGRVIVPAAVLVEDLYCKPIQVHYQLLDEVRSRFRSAAAVPDCQPDHEDGTKLFLSREGADTTRTLINQDRVEALLDARGFQKVRTENMPLEEQVRLFSRAVEVVAPHGAGLFLTLFMNGGHVTELFPEHPEEARDPGKRLVEPCWFRILGAHSESGRSLSWDSIKCPVEMLSEIDLSRYRLMVDLDRLAQNL